MTKERKIGCGGILLFIIIGLIGNYISDEIKQKQSEKEVRKFEKSIDQHYANLIDFLHKMNYYEAHQEYELFQKYNKLDYNDVIELPILAGLNLKQKLAKTKSIDKKITIYKKLSDFFPKNQLIQNKLTSLRISNLEKKVKPIPVSKAAENLKIYKQLLNLDSDNRKYKKKVAFYQAKVKQKQKEKKSDLEKIVFEYERQEVFKGSQQKFFITIRNNSKKVFKGFVEVLGKDFQEHTVDSDTIFVDKLAPNGAERGAILWFENPNRIDSLYSRISGEFTPITVKAPDVPYEEVGKRAGLNYMTFFVYTPSKKRDSLQKIIDMYKTRYNSLFGFQIWFFDNKQNTPQDLPLSDKAKKCQFANYARNKNNGYDELTFIK